MNRFLDGMYISGAMGMQVHYFCVMEFFGVEFFKYGIGNLGGGYTVGISHGKINGTQYGESTPGVGQYCHAYVRHALFDSIVCLGSFGQGAARVKVNGDITIGAFFHFFAPGFAQL